MWFTAQKERQAERQNRIKAQSQVRIFVLGSVFVLLVLGNSRDYQRQNGFPDSGANLREKDVISRVIFRREQAPALL